MKKLLLTSLFCAITPFAMAAGDASAGKASSAICAACHGADGNSPASAFPHIAGQHESYIVKQLKDIKSGVRSVPEMTAFVANMSEQEMRNLGAFYAAQTAQGGATKPELLAKGERVYRAGNHETGVAACAACHGPDGKGNKGAAYPRLAGQYPEYLEKQLRAFQVGADEPEANNARTNDGDSRTMRDVAHHLSDLEIRAVSSFIAGLR